MSIINDILRDIRTALSLVSTTRLSSSNASDIFEAYVFSLLIEAAENEGGDISFMDVNGRIGLVLFLTR
jgi:hypothetical protein